MAAARYRCAAPQAAIQLPNLSPFCQKIQTRSKDLHTRVLDAISRSPLDDAYRQQCSDFVMRLRIYKNLFMHTYVHLACCNRSKNLSHLVRSAKTWETWGSIGQLMDRSSIEDTLVSFWENSSCSRHQFLRHQNFVIKDDDSNLLLHLLYCGTKDDFYKLPAESANREKVDQVIELFWKFLMRPNERDVARHLRSDVYRLARKSAYLPRSLRIEQISISNTQNLGSGAKGRVMMAKMHGQDVAVKKILFSDPSTRKKCLEMFASEAILWKTLDHKNIVPFLGVIVDGVSDISLVLKLFRNGNIKKYMDKCTAKERLKLARKWGKDLAEGLEYIHSHEPPIIHGDIKGDNVLIGDDGHACLSDFGQAHASDSRKYLDSTRVGLANNSIYWMAPELIAGDKTKASEKSDIYSFGCVIYEIVSDMIPFEKLGMADVAKLVLRGNRPDMLHWIRQDDPLWNVAKLCWKGSDLDRPSAKQVVSLFHNVS